MSLLVLPVFFLLKSKLSDINIAIWVLLIFISFFLWHIFFISLLLLSLPIIFEVSFLQTAKTCFFVSLIHCGHVFLLMICFRLLIFNVITGMLGLRATILLFVADVVCTLCFPFFCFPFLPSFYSLKQKPLKTGKVSNFLEFNFNLLYF